MCNLYSLLREFKKPRRLHADDLQLILERIDRMDKKISDALDALGAAADAEISKLSVIEQQLRDAQSLNDSESTAIADRIASITGRLTGVVSETTSAVTDAGQGSTGSGAQTDTGDGSGGASTAQPVGDQPQGSSGGDVSGAAQESQEQPQGSTGNEGGDPPQD